MPSSMSASAAGWMKSFDWKIILKFKTISKESPEDVARYLGERKVGVFRRVNSYGHDRQDAVEKSLGVGSLRSKNDDNEQF